MTGAIILSSGTGRRMGGAEVPKQYLPVMGKPILVYAVEPFQKHKSIDAIWIVASGKWEKSILKWKREYGLDKVQVLTLPGNSRQETILHGLRAAADILSGHDGIIVQDGVRPLCSQAVITELIDGLMEAPCVMPALPVTDTVYLSEDGKYVSGILDRGKLFAGQAPEAFWFAPYLQICEEQRVNALTGIHGSSQLSWSRGMEVKMIPGDPENIKVTYPSDLQLFEAILKRRDVGREG